MFKITQEKIDRKISRMQNRVDRVRMRLVRKYILLVSPFKLGDILITKTGNFKVEIIHVGSGVVYPTQRDIYIEPCYTCRSIATGKECGRYFSPDELKKEN